MAKHRLYWDTSVFLCFLNQDERDRALICEDILQHAAMDELLILTSTYTIAEVIRPKNRAKNSRLVLTDKQVEKIKGMFRWPFIRTIELDDRTALYASDLSREVQLAPSDAVHAASALLWSADALQAWDRDFSRVADRIKVEQPRFLSKQRLLEGMEESRLGPAPEDFEENV